jgi:hypothetical protein
MNVPKFVVPCCINTIDIIVKTINLVNTMKSSIFPMPLALQIFINVKRPIIPSAIPFLIQILSTKSVLLIA